MELYSLFPMGYCRCQFSSTVLDIPTLKPIIGKGGWYYNDCLRQIIIHPLGFCYERFPPIIK